MEISIFYRQKSSNEIWNVSEINISSPKIETIGSCSKYRSKVLLFKTKCLRVCEHILFFNSAQACCVRLVASVRWNYTREQFFFDIVRFTDCHKAIYVNLWKNYTHKISRTFITKCLKRVRSYVHQHACAEKLTYFYICLLKMACMRKKIT